MRILASDGMDKSAIAALKEMGHEVVEQFYEPEELAEQVKQYDILVVRSATKVRKPIIDAAKETGKLKLIIRGGVGVDNIDVAYAEENGIHVRNTPRASSNTVAELALAHMLSVARFISIAGHTMREDKWEKKAYKGIELAGRTLGVIGYGRIGQALGLCLPRTIRARRACRRYLYRCICQSIRCCNTFQRMCVHRLRTAWIYRPY